ncbi:hypothetical protein H072_893 [Dactylellina haptotyla CBS 200.50]|uniref:Endo-chitosanase n=1 Tax=Dactylellina haptotyla (strain CBS 200.50) TaxID=1284197 RepID=S8AQ50_DACHA|nr:hypothetical protein H072_893 [Dactylellina haptotyla CBS 200.50]
MLQSTIVALLLATSASAWSLPSNLKTFYNGVKAGGCKAWLKNNHNLDDGQGHKGWGYCTDTANAVYLSGKNSLGDMDIDCDGAHNCGGLSGDFQAQTSFDDILKKSYGIKTLDASIHQFSVLGTCHVSMTGTIEPLALVAVVCGGNLFYSVWGDTNGCDGDDYTGEASISLAQLCFPKEGLNGNNGHTAHDVLYLAFKGKDAVVGPSNANWKAKTPQEFQNSLKAFGDSVLKKKFGSTIPVVKTTTTTVCPTSTPAPACEWIGHCLGASCKTENDCDGQLVCKSGKCAR